MRDWSVFIPKEDVLLGSTPYRGLNLRWAHNNTHAGGSVEARQVIDMRLEVGKGSCIGSKLMVVE